MRKARCEVIDSTEVNVVHVVPAPFGDVFSSATIC